MIVVMCCHARSKHTMQNRQTDAHFNTPDVDNRYPHSTYATHPSPQRWVVDAVDERGRLFPGPRMVVACHTVYTWPCGSGN